MEETANVVLAPVREPAPLMLRRRIDDAQLEAVYERESRSLVGMLWVFTGDKAAAEDLAQEAFVRLALAWHRVQDPERAGPYLRSIAFNLARSHYRRATTARLHQPTSLPEMASAEATALLNDAERQLLDALRSLPDRQRECLVLRFYADLEPLQIAATLGVSVNSVKTHLRRGLDALRTRMGDER
jgi:RNA polymerase sigma-70 factor (sigma-E family)